MMKSYIPSNLNLGAEKHSDKYYYIISILYYARIFDKRFTPESYISLNAKVLVQIFGGRYKQYLIFLLKRKIIETDNQYFPNVKSKGYRLTKKYRDVMFKKVEIVDKKLIAKIEKHKQVQKSTSNSTYEYLEYCLKNVSVDYSGAYNYIEQNITGFNRFISYNLSLDLINSPEDRSLIVDSIAGRVHTNVSNLPKKLRKFLSYKNEPLVEIDLANSQPFFLNLLILRYYTETYSLSCSGSNYLSYGNQNNKIVPFTPKDVIKYKELTSQGMLYEYLMDKMNIDEDRKKFKVRFFKKILYCKENENYIPKERRQFRKLFPNVAKIISHFKKDDYKQFAINLQKAEADIMINKIVPRLAEKKIFVLTIHDSILTTHENSETVKKIILDEFKNQYGLVPTIKMK